MTNDRDGANVTYADMKPGYVIHECGCMIIWLILAVIERAKGDLEVMLLDVQTLKIESWIAQGDYPVLDLDDDLWDENGKPIVESYGSSFEKVHQVV